MPSDPRTFITLHDGMPEHPKIAPLSDAAFRALIELWCYCSRTLSDGLVPDAIVRRYTTPKSRRELAARGLAVETGEGIDMHDYLEHQRSRAEVEDLREKRRAAGSKGGKAKATRVAGATASATADSQPAGSKSVPESETESGTNVPDESRADVEALCDHLADRIAGNGSKRPTITKGWRDAARLMLDRDDRTAEQVHAAIDWSQDDDFWRSNILSMPKLREKYDQLRLQAQRQDRTPVDRQAEILRAERERMAVQDLGLPAIGGAA